MFINIFTALTFVSACSTKHDSNASWPDTDSQQKAFLKLNNMKNSIGAANLALDNQKLDGFYSILDFLPTDTLRELTRKLTLFHWQINLRQIIKPAECIEVINTCRAHTVNAFYWSG
jgi:predicted metalloendopeptidase